MRWKIPRVLCVGIVAGALAVSIALRRDLGTAGVMSLGEANNSGW